VIHQCRSSLPVKAELQKGFPLIFNPRNKKIPGFKIYTPIGEFQKIRAFF
jgi:hypothetical protein